MHESPLCAAVLDAVLARAGDRRVAGITVAVGVSHRAVDEAFDELFRSVALGTVAEGCAVELRQLPYRYECRGCGRTGELADPIPLCPTCDDAVRVSGGDEIMLESLTYVEA